MDDKALRTWEDARDMAAELEQSIYEMLAGQDKAADVSPVVTMRTQSAP